MSYDSLEKLYYKDPEHYQEIYRERFQSDAAAHLDIKIGNNLAFYVETTQALHTIISIVETENKLQALQRRLPGVALKQFSLRCLIDEIVVTNDIEGVSSTRRDISAILDDAEKSDRKKRFHGLVQKYLLLNDSSSKPIPLSTCQDIRNIYDDLVSEEIKEDDPDNLPDGKFFRHEIVYVHSGTQKIIHTGLYPEPAIEDAMEKALAFLNNESIHSLIRISIFHYLFGYIHPFYDGNGRTSRFISSYLLSQKVDSLLGYRLSATIKENTAEYYKVFQTCNHPRNLGDLTPFLLFFLGIIQTACNQLYDALSRRAYDLNNYAKLLHSISSIDQNPTLSQLGYYLLQAELFSEDGISLLELLDEMGLSRTTLHDKLKTFHSMNLLIEQKRGTRKFYKLDITALEQLSMPS